MYDETKDIFWLIDVVIEYFAGLIITIIFFGLQCWLNMMGLTININDNTK